MNHAETIRRFYAAWVRDDLEAVLAMCTDDVVAVNVPIGPLEGKQAVRRFFTRFGTGMTDKQYEVRHVLVGEQVATVEGVECYVKDGRPVRLPYMTTFEFAGELIRGWRDYFDLQTVQRQLGLDTQAAAPRARRATDRRARPWRSRWSPRSAPSDGPHGSIPRRRSARTAC
ncbi:MAG: nuclear transport factor 2 family protein [Steroidobacteraceae bacterium]